MELENIESAATETPESWSSIPVALEFDVGTLTMSLDDVTKLQPGYAFVLEAPAAGTNVRIRANGVVVGQGQLVIVGETLGVNVTRWSDNGFQ